MTRSECGIETEIKAILDEAPQTLEEINQKILKAPPILCKTKQALSDSDIDLFKQAEKYYKLIKPQKNTKYTKNIKKTDYSKCFDFSQQENILKYLENNVIEVVSENCYRFTDPQLNDFYILPNYLATETQKHLIDLSINEWCKPPAATNVRRLLELGQEETCKVGDSETVLSPGCDRIRWANLGYKYDWTHREYFKSEPRVGLPDILEDISIEVCKKAKIDSINSPETKNNEYKPDSCLINYYKLDTQFCGHLDDAEINAEQHPIINITLGLSAVFLHGKGENNGPTKEYCRNRKIEPAAIILNNGTIAIMSGKSRMCLHGVPRIIENSLTDNLNDALLESMENETNKEYIKNHRININVRMYNG